MVCSSGAYTRPVVAIASDLLVSIAHLYRWRPASTQTKNERNRISQPHVGQVGPGKTQTETPRIAMQSSADVHIISRPDTLHSNIDVPKPNTEHLCTMHG